MSKFEVWSLVVGEDRDTPATERLEVTRTDSRVANDDRNLIADVLHRKAWVREVT